MKKLIQYFTSFCCCCLIYVVQYPKVVLLCPEKPFFITLLHLRRQFCLYLHYVVFLRHNTWVRLGDSDPAPQSQRTTCALPSAMHAHRLRRRHTTADAPLWLFICQNIAHFSIAPARRPFPRTPRAALNHGFA